MSSYFPYLKFSALQELHVISMLGIIASTHKVVKSAIEFGDHTYNETLIMKELNFQMTEEDILRSFIGLENTLLFFGICK